MVAYTGMRERGSTSQRSESLRDMVGLVRLMKNGKLVEWYFRDPLQLREAKALARFYRQEIGSAGMIPRSRMPKGARLTSSDEFHCFLTDSTPARPRFNKRAIQILEQIRESRATHETSTINEMRYGLPAADQTTLVRGQQIAWQRAHQDADQYGSELPQHAWETAIPHTCFVGEADRIRAEQIAHTRKMLAESRDDVDELADEDTSTGFRPG